MIRSHEASFRWADQFFEDSAELIRIISILRFNNFQSVLRTSFILMNPAIFIVQFF